MSSRGYWEGIKPPKKKPADKVVMLKVSTTPWQIKVLDSVRAQHHLTRAAVIRKLLKLGLMRYNETGMLPENEE